MVDARKMLISLCSLAVMSCAAQQGWHQDAKGPYHCPVDPAKANLTKGRFAVMDGTPDPRPLEAGDFVFAFASIKHTERLAEIPNLEDAFVPVMDADLTCVYASSRSSGKTLSLRLRQAMDSWRAPLGRDVETPWRVVGRTPVASESGAEEPSAYANNIRCDVSAAACEFFVWKRPY